MHRIRVHLQVFNIASFMELTMCLEKASVCADHKINAEIVKSSDCWSLEVQLISGGSEDRCMKKVGLQ